MNVYTWTPAEMAGWLRAIARFVDEGCIAEAQLPDMRHYLDEVIRFLPEFRENISESNIGKALGATA